MLSESCCCISHFPLLWTDSHFFILFIYCSAEIGTALWQLVWLYYPGGKTNKFWVIHFWTSIWSWAFEPWNTPGLLGLPSANDHFTDHFCVFQNAKSKEHFVVKMPWKGIPDSWFLSFANFQVGTWLLASNLTSLTPKHFLYKAMLILAKLSGFKVLQNQIKIFEILIYR